MGQSQIISSLYYLRALSTILPQYCTTYAQIGHRLLQYCTACGHLIQFRGNIALPVYT